MKAFILLLVLLTAFSTNAAFFGDFVLESSDQKHTLQTKQNGNVLLFKCDIRHPEIQTVLDTQRFYAYHDDPSILILELNGFKQQLSGDGSGSIFSSCFDCDNDKLNTIFTGIKSSTDSVLNLEALSLSSGISSHASFKINELNEAMVELQKNCQQLSMKTANLHL